MHMTGKDRAALKRLGQSLEPVIWVGKSGLTPALEKSVDEALTARELVKGKVQPESPLSAREVGEILAEACQASMVATIGRTFLLYRPDPDQPRITLEG